MSITAEFPKEINEVSSSFVEIYTQAETAESSQLDQVAGAGYRKALEFLIKDYCCSIHPDNAEDIKRSLLAACIERYVNDERVKACAQRAAWLGNDEVHYIRKWTDKDIGDLRRLIQLTVIWIQAASLTERYSSEMQRKASPRN